MIIEFIQIYGILALTHLVIQIALSHAHYIKSYRSRIPDYYPKVAIIIPSYNEPVVNVLRCVHSCLRQDYENDIKIYFVDDCGSDRSALDHVKSLNHPDIVILEHTKNKGKREAQKTAFEAIPDDIEIYVTIDSDAILHPDAVKNLVRRFMNPRVGATTGNVRGIHTNFLSKLIDLRYWTAFNQERGSQSLFGTVLCCCGVLSAYRASIIKKVLKKYTNQVFLGTVCTYGDDRHLTNLVLAEGYKVHYEQDSVADTSVPLDLRTWLKQQARWNRSFYRELIYSLNMIIKKRRRKVSVPQSQEIYSFKTIIKERRKFRFYIVYDLLMQAILPLLLLLSLILMVIKSFSVGIIFLLSYLSVLTGIALIRGVYAFMRTRNTGFFYFPAYAFLHVFLLIPVRFYALLTLRTSKWGTRDGHRNFS